jgi:hypothetical protein
MPDVKLVLEPWLLHDMNNCTPVESLPGRQTSVRYIACRLKQTNSGTSLHDTSFVSVAQEVSSNYLRIEYKP